MESQLGIGVFRQLLQQIIPHDMCIVGVFLCQKSTVADPLLEVIVRGQGLTGNPGIFTEFFEFFGICP